MPKRAPEAEPISDARAEFKRLLRTLSHAKAPWQVFRDFCELAALSIANSMGGPFIDPKREERYLRIIGTYDAAKGEHDALGRMLACVVVGLDGEEPPDFLGSVFMELDLGSHWAGQYFTPMPVCRMMAEMTADADALRAIVAERGFVRVSEPAAGSGAMVIALSATMRAHGFNPQRQLYVEAVDVDATACHMAFVQLALLGLPAIVWHGNALTLDMHESFTTPMYHLGGWVWKLRRAQPGHEALPEGAPAPAAPDSAPESARHGLAEEPGVNATVAGTQAKLW